MKKRLRVLAGPTAIFLVGIIVVLSILAYIAPGECTNFLLEEGVRGHSLSLTELALTCGANPRLENEYHVSFLGLAARHGDRRIVETLLAYGANPDVRNYLGQPAMDTISDPEIVHMLQEAMREDKKSVKTH